MSRRLFPLIALGLVASVLAPAGARTGPGALPDLDRIDPVRYRYDAAIVEREMITARDGLTALALDVIRPRTDEPVPTILLQSPYYNTTGRGWRREMKTPWLEPHVPTERIPLLGGGGEFTAFPEWYDEYFVPRGYAVVLQDQRGTRNSSGCQVYGGREEVTDAVDTIAWIAAQPWSNGAVGMTGGSYDGTVAIGAAAMAPEPLKAIIPIRAISRWYDYHFFNGVQSADHFLTPWVFTTGRPLIDVSNAGTEDLLLPMHIIERRACAASIGALVAARYGLPVQDATDPFWRERDYLIDARRIRAATMLVHGLGDWNVKPSQAGHLWSALPRRVPKALWWFRGAHADPASPEAGETLPFPFPERFVEGTHRWFAQFLKGLDAGARRMAPVGVQDERGRWWDASSWPPPAADQTLFLGEQVLRRRAGGTEAVLRPRSGGLRFASPRLERARRLAGQSYVRLTYELDGGGDATFAATLFAEGPEGATRIAAGYARGSQRGSIERRGPSWPAEVEPHLPGERAVVAFPLWHHDVVVPEGARLVLRLSVTDDHTTDDSTVSEIRIGLNGQSKLVVPFARSRAAEQRRWARSRS